jgi:glutamate decarboxylase
MHYSFDKAADLLGLGTAGLLRVPAGHDGRIDLRRLEQTIAGCHARGDKVIALVGIAGTTETGAVDPLDAMADLAGQHGLQFHVDAAWGGPTLFSRAHAGLLAGVARADSVTIDGHKQLYLPMGLGMVLLRDPAEAAVIEKAANYIIRPGSEDLGRRSLEGSRPAMVMYLHAALHLLGRAGYEALIEGGLQRTREMAAQVAARPDFELISEPELNILVYRLIPPHLAAAAADFALGEDAQRSINDLNRWVQEQQWAHGTSFISRTTLAHTRHGSSPPVVCLRAVLANPLTGTADIAAVLDEQSALAARYPGARER